MLEKLFFFKFSIKIKGNDNSSETLCGDSGVITAVTAPKNIRVFADT